MKPVSREAAQYRLREKGTVQGKVSKLTQPQHCGDYNPSSCCSPEVKRKKTAAPNLIPNTSTDVIYCKKVDLKTKCNIQTPFPEKLQFLDTISNMKNFCLKQTSTWEASRVNIS